MIINGVMAGPRQRKSWFTRLAQLKGKPEV